MIANTSSWPTIFHIFVAWAIINFNEAVNEINFNETVNEINFNETVNEIVEKVRDDLIGINNGYAMYRFT